MHDTCSGAAKRTPGRNGALLSTSGTGVSSRMRSAVDSERLISKIKICRFAMIITLTLPDDIAQHPGPGREALEALIIEGYHSEALTSYQARQLLGLSRFEFEGF